MKENSQQCQQCQQCQMSTMLIKLSKCQANCQNDNQIVKMSIKL